MASSLQGICFPSLKAYDAICGGQFPVDHSLPLLLFLPFHICVCETTLRSFHESKAQQLRVVCFTYLLASAAPQMSSLHFCPAGPQGIFYLWPYMWHFFVVCGCTERGGAPLWGATCSLVSGCNYHHL